MRIPQKVKDLFNKTSLIAFGTCDTKCNPNINIVFWKFIYDDESILLIDNYFKKTEENLLQNKKVCISFFDNETEEGYQMKGECEYSTQGEVYEKGKEYIQNRKPGRIPKGVALIKVNKIFILTPNQDAGKEYYE